MSADSQPAPAVGVQPGVARAPKRDALIVRVDDQLIVFPTDDSQGPQCVAAGRKRGSRCAWSAQSGHYDGWSEWVIPGRSGHVSALEPGSTPLEGFLRQRCGRHLESNAPDVIEPEWERFDPDRHSSLIRPHWSVWTPDGLRSRWGGAGSTADSTPASGAAGDLHDILIEAERRREERRLAESVETALYSYYDADKVALYIGISDDLRTRTLAHLEASSWMDFAASCTITRHPSRSAALDAEKKAIQAEQPLFNHMHNATPEARARLVAYLVQHDRLDLLAPAVSRG